VHAALVELFGIDRRSLAAFRIGLGLLLIWDLVGRARSLRAHYTADGVYPAAEALQLRPSSPLFHVFLWSDAFTVQAALFVVFGVLALLLVLGWRTRIVSVLAFVFLASLVRRNPYVCHTGDTWLKTLAFWAMLLPLGSAFSLDRLRGRGPPPESTRAFSLVTAGALLQVAAFYVSAGYLKSRYEVWTRGDAVWVFTHAVEYTRPFGAWLGRFPGLCRALTYGTLVLEGLLPLLFFSPFATRWIRGALILVFASFHVTLSAVIHIGIFQLVCIVALFLFVPGAFWDALAARMLRTRWSEWRTRWLARFGVEARERRPAGRLARIVPQAIAAASLVVILVSNVNTATKDPYDREDRGPLPLPPVVDAYGRELSIVQNWNMFTDIDRLFFGWFQVLGQLDDGSVVDLLEHAPFTGIVRPKDYAAHFPNHNTRRYWREIALSDRDFLYPPLCRSLALEWEREGGAPLAHIAILQIGRVPSKRPDADRVKRICVWERPTADPAESERLRALRTQWKAFLEALPERVPLTEM